MSEFVLNHLTATEESFVLGGSVEKSRVFRPITLLEASEQGVASSAATFRKALLEGSGDIDLSAEIDRILSLRSSFAESAPAPKIDHEYLSRRW